MTLAGRLGAHVSRSTQRKGREYFDWGFVPVIAGDSFGAHAKVTGSQVYDVSLLRDGAVVAASCTCPVAASRIVCKHVWAAVLAADERGYLTSPVDVDEQLDLRLGGAPLASSSRRPVAAGSGAAVDAGVAGKSATRAADWQTVMSALRASGSKSRTAESGPAWPIGHQLVYVLDPAGIARSGDILLHLQWRERKANGEWGKPKTKRVRYDAMNEAPEVSDRRVLGLLTGARPWDTYTTYDPFSFRELPSSFRLPQALRAELLRELCLTGRCYLAGKTGEIAGQPLAWDDGPPWELWLDASREEGTGALVVEGYLRRGDERMRFQDTVALLSGSCVLTTTQVARLADFGAFPWVVYLKQAGRLVVPAADARTFVAEMGTLPAVPRIDLPAELRVEEDAGAPRPLVRVRKPASADAASQPLRAEVSFDYVGLVAAADDPARALYDAKRGRLVRRDRAREQAWIDTLADVGVRPGWNRSTGRTELLLAPKQLPEAVRTLLDRGWRVEADDRVYRQARGTKLEVVSGTDWFELRGTVDFDGKIVKMPALLRAVRSGERTVELGDGSLGILPEEWLHRHELLAAFGAASGNAVRYSRAQGALLAALLDDRPEVTFDEAFERARASLESFTGIEPLDPPPSFCGELRPYQRTGLGWLLFLRRMGFGGCLADDMGLGKTIQVLAYLEHRRVAGDATGPTLIVVPRSLVFNWMQEAARFTPALAVVDYTGQRRRAVLERPGPGDVVLTTYGTLRNDIAHFSDVTFDLIVLDEAHAIKNAASLTARAARVLQGAQRLALTGTPVQNHLGELWSLFEFLNPGLLGRAKSLPLLEGPRLDEEGRALLARALRPFVLRRTKAAVASDLPEKTEQTIYCELAPKERRAYDELRDYYRQALLARVDREGVAKSRFHVLEALLRLRQAACHPVLVDKNWAEPSSSKLDLLTSHLTEIADEGHKTLVFSQFTSLLALVERRLEQEGLVYEYLDGRTRDRAARVQRFQEDAACPVFLISLKAGGLGLNLTAAEYVFLLDPWWNPAVEAQAIDRTHRIGQTRGVFAYRLIARDTVEEKVLELQQQKREIAESIISEDPGPLSRLSRSDLELLLS